MVSGRIGICLAAMACALACGERPDLPGVAAGSDEPSGAGDASGNGGNGGDITVLEAQTRPPPEPEELDPSPPVADAGSADDGDEGPPSGDPVAEGAGPAALACAEDVSGCFIVNIAVSDRTADSCVQLSLDDCENSAQPGLPVALPVPWRLGAAFVNRSADDCVPGARFNAMNSTAIVGASGSIRWDLTTRLPSQVVLDLTLEPSRTALDQAPISLVNSDLVEQLSECE